MKYLVWFSGGIDSTFVAWHLKQQWHQVLLVNLKNTTEPNKCCSLPVDLIKKANILDIPLKIVDATKDFKKFVIDDFSSSYLKWKTPNPCINCNELVRFQILDNLRKELWYDKIATGHYAKILDIENKKYLAVAKDQKKEQSYMIYRILSIPNILDNIEFPLADIEKQEIKEIAQKEWFFSANEWESQNICFIPDDDYPRYIRQHKHIIIPTGPIYDMKGNYLADHKWIIYYTIWQRHGLNIASNNKYYVIKIDYKNNAIYVWDEKNLMKDKLVATDMILEKDLVGELFGKIRFKASMQAIKKIEVKGNLTSIIFQEPQRAITPGQHIVLYKKIADNYIVLWWWEIIHS